MYVYMCSLARIQQIYSNKKTEKKTLGVYLNMCICKPSITNLNIIYINDAKKKKRRGKLPTQVKNEERKVDTDETKRKRSFQSKFNMLVYMCVCVCL